jgi:hypothetical protein
LCFDFQFIGLHLPQIELASTNDLFMHLLTMLTAPLHPTDYRPLVKLKRDGGGLHRTPMCQ